MSFLPPEPSVLPCTCHCCTSPTRRESGHRLTPFTPILPTPMARKPCYQNPTWAQQGRQASHTGGCHSVKEGTKAGEGEIPPEGGNRLQTSTPGPPSINSCPNKIRFSMSSVHGTQLVSIRAPQPHVSQRLYNTSNI